MVLTFLRETFGSRGERGWSWRKMAGQSTRERIRRQGGMAAAPRRNVFYPFFVSLLSFFYLFFCQSFLASSWMRGPGEWEAPL